MKTGYTDTAGYCITTTAFKNNMRLITVVMGEPTSLVRNSETTSMLDYGFNTYQLDTVLSKNKILKKENLELANDTIVNIVPVSDVNILNTKVGTKRNVDYELDLNNIKVPVKVGDVVGKIKILEDNKVIMTVDATVDKDIDKANVFVVYFRNLLDIMSGGM